MKKNYKLLLVGATALVFVLMLIYKQAWLTQLAYEQQRLLLKKTDLTKEREECTRTLCQLKDPESVLEYATNSLGMKKMDLSQAKKCCPENTQS